MRSLRLAVLLVFVGSAVKGCGGSESADPDGGGPTDAGSRLDGGSSADAGPAVDSGLAGRVDITDLVFTERSGDCADHARSAEAFVTDVKRAQDFTGRIDLVAGSSACLITSNAIPNHDFDDATAQFATPVAELTTTWSIPRAPAFAASSTALTLDSFDAVMLNGVVLDLLAAGCFGVADGRIGCFDSSTPWRYDPMAPTAGFGTDMHNAHTQPDGRYHYHGDPLAMYGEPGLGPSPVIGFAADGFPIYGPYFDDGTEIRAAESGYTLRAGIRSGGPGGSYDGTYVDDWEYTGAGDLDECNGMTVDGQYGYYVTASYPWVIGCLRGTPDPSFRKMM